MISLLLALAIAVCPILANFDIDSNPNAIGVFYAVWHSLGYDGIDTPPDVTEIENGNGAYAPEGTFHFWGRPDGGYYQGGNRPVLDRHFSQISGAGIDFIVIDATNLQGYGGYQPGLFTEPTDVLMDEMLVQRQAGNPTPNVVLWARSEPTDTDPNAVIQFIIDRYMHNASYADLFVNLGGKPLIVTTNLQPTQFTTEFTLRKMWAEEPIDEPGEWSFMQYYPQSYGIDENEQTEQLTVSCAQQRPYISDKSQGLGRNMGANYQQQWSTAFNQHPKVLFLYGWNEWMAQRQADDANGNVQFVDEFDSEFSKDIEPQDPNQVGGHGANYLSWTGTYIAAYKSNQPMPGGLIGY